MARVVQEVDQEEGEVVVVEVVAADVVVVAEASRSADDWPLHKRKSSEVVFILYTRCFRRSMRLAWEGQAHRQMCHEEGEEDCLFR